jgi:hypothetical protein
MTRTEQRAFPRQEPRRSLRLWLTAPGLGGGDWAELRDLSPGGTGLHLEHPLEPGARCLLWGHAPSAPPVPLTVVHARPWRGGHFLGCAFDRPLTPADLATLLDG